MCAHEQVSTHNQGVRIPPERVVAALLQDTGIPVQEQPIHLGQLHHDSTPLVVAGDKYLKAEGVCS
jgi:hypothetical protein